MKLRTRILALTLLLVVFAALIPAAAYAGGVALEPPESADTETDKKPELSRRSLDVLTGVLMVAGGGIAGWLTRRKRNKTDKSQASVRDNRPDSFYDSDRTQPWYGGDRVELSERLYLFCRGGYQDGKEYPLKAEVNIGRAKDSDIKYPDDWPGISRHHAVIKVFDNPDGMRVELTDLSSTDVYLKKGSIGESKANKIPKKKPIRLRPGDVFYLGTKENRFELIRKS